MTRRRLVELIVASLVLAGCGTTVPQSTVLGAQSPGFGGDSTVPGASAVPGPGGAPGTTGAGPVPSTTLAGGTTTGSSVGPLPSVPPAGRDTSPLKIGVTYINNDTTSSQLGVDDPTTVTKKSIVEGLIRAINAKGGIDGRRLVPVEYEWNSQSNNWSGDATAACARFTQDQKVSVVVDNAFGTIGGFRDCLQRAGVFVIQSGPEGDSVASGQATLHANANGMTVDRSYSAVLRGLASTGYLSKANHLGVMIEGCPDNTRAWTHVLKPLIAHLGLPAADEVTIDCTTGFASAGPAATAVNSAILRFRGRGVDRVMFVSDNESVLVLLWGNEAESQGYRPGYVLSSAAQAQALRSQLRPAQQALFHGVGSLPFSDTDGAKPNAADTRCLQLLKSVGLTPASYADTSTIVFECAPFLLLEAAVEAADGAGTTAALTSAVASLGGSFLAPGVLQGATRYDPTRHDGPDQAQVFGYLPACSCLHYSGSPFIAPERNS